MNMRVRWSALLSVVLASPVLAFDKAAVMENIRETYSFPPGVDLSLGDPKPSEVPSFDVLDVTLSRGPARETERLYISKNGRYYILGGFKDVTVSPDKERMKKMDLRTSPVRGNKKAGVAIVEYTDFQCPYCQMGYQVMRERIMKEFGSKVQWVYKSFPLKRIHPWAEPAARAAECAHRQGERQFWSLHDSIFDHQKELTLRSIDEKLNEYAKINGLDMKKFEACYKGSETAGEVNKDLLEAEEIKIPGAPGFVINGRLTSGDYESLKQTIEGALKKYERS